MKKLYGFAICAGFLTFCWYSFDHIDHAESAAITEQRDLSNQQLETTLNQLNRLKDLNKSLLEEADNLAKLREEGKEVNTDRLWIMLDKVKQQVNSVEEITDAGDK